MTATVADHRLLSNLMAANTSEAAYIDDQGEYVVSILLVPGFMLDADLWRDVEPGLADFQPIVSVDLSKDSSIQDMARRALLGAPEAFILVGFSMGGYVAREIVRQAPHRVKALVLVATSARGDTDLQRQRKAAITGQPNGLIFKGLSTAAVASSLYPDNASRLDLIDRIKSMAQRLGGEVFRRQSLLDREDERASLSAITYPCLIVAGEDDKLRSRAEAEELHRGIVGSSLQIIEKTGHMIPLEAPDALATIVRRWLKAIEA
ncbi:alpha/beta hydrolase [Rhizobium sp. S96]|uniref:alpha/beta fold hydrolase n=1 Tax=Rhizobium sp. S96 TaxID=3055140 RepID=UPI0025AB1C39|nr:alpha/beta hydrolase [Rhizobium sp. S96]MDM9623119.1 alpha/beta hydrolase [Rhizobium sp. S96]